jgi:predicted HTH transcriptional regulator
MGIRKIQDDIDFKEAMKKKGAELELKEVEAKASVKEFTKDRLRGIAKEHGIILALTDEMKAQIKDIQEEFDIPSSKIITEQIEEVDILKTFNRIDHEKLGMLAYQRVLLQKEETGGFIPLSEVFELVNTGELKGDIDIKDVAKAMGKLKKGDVIEDIRKLESGAVMVQFFPIQYTNDQQRVLDLAKEKGYVTLEDVSLKLDWTQDRALRALKSLEKSGTAKKTESLLKGKEWYFPGL